MQKLPDTGQNIRRLVENREYEAAIAELRNLQRSGEKSFTTNNYDYLLARVAEANGDLSAAMAGYQAVVNGDSALAAYALKHLSQIARSTGNLMLERLYLNEIVMFSPDSLVAKSAVLRLAANSFETESYSETIRIVNSMNSEPKRSGQTTNMREIQALLAAAHLRAGKEKQARTIFTYLINDIPNPEQPDDVAKTAAEGLDFLDGGAENLGKTAPKLTEAEHLRRADIYQFNRDFTNAKLHFEALIAGYPNGQNTAEAVFQIGRAFVGQNNFVEALKWFERAIEQYPDSAAAKEALLNAASAYGRVGKPREAITRYDSFIAKFPTDEKLDRAYLNIVDILRDQGEETEALRRCSKIRDIFRGKTPEAVSLFTESRIYIGREDWQNAFNSLERLRQLPDLGGAAVPGGTSTLEVDFLKGFALENLEKYPEAIAAYLDIADGRSQYYGWRATERLKGLANDEIAAPHVAQIVGTLVAGLNSKNVDTRRKSAHSILRLTDLPDLRSKALRVLGEEIKALPRYRESLGIEPMAYIERSTSDPPGTVAERLLLLGLYDEAALELEAEMKTPQAKSIEQAFTMAAYFKRGGHAERVLDFIEPIWRKLPSDFPLGLIPQHHLEMLYPAPYADQLLRYAPKHGVDPRLVLAIMRQESRFQPDAKSFAAARGLMQFISTTAARIAGEAGRENFRQDDLYHPPTAILFGSQYLADLFEIFPNQPDAVAASYNAGEDNMKRWLLRSNSNLPERYVPEILYSQTKDYVYKVMTNYRMYQFIYDERLRPK